MPKNYPPRPDYSSPGFRAEQQVWQVLQGLPDEVAVFSQYRVLNKYRASLEADFLIAWPGVGLAVLEVKGGRIWSAGTDWFSRDSRGVDHQIKDPVQQARNVGYALAEFAQSMGWQWPRNTTVPIAVLPDTRLPRSFTTANSEPAQWIDQTALARLPALLGRAMYSTEGARLTPDDVTALADLLEHRLPQPSEREAAEIGREQADMITREQYAILLALRTNDRILVTGGPGTGKTWLALEHARQETILGARVAVICYNRALATDLQTQVARWPVGQRPDYVGTLHDLALRITGRTVPDPTPSEFWDELLAAMAATRPAHDDVFDLLVIDEGQDLRSEWWDALAVVLADPDDGPVVVFADEDQRLYEERPPVMIAGAVEVVLRENVRNTPEVGQLLAELPGGTGPSRRLSGPAPQFIPVPEGRSVIEIADSAVKVLLASGEWQPRDIALLTTYRRHPDHLHKLELMGATDYARNLAAGTDLAVSTVKSFKGLERPVIVLAVDGFYSTETAAEQLRVGISRATHRLVVVATPEELAEVCPGLLGALTG